MRYLITGGAGFIGSHLAEALLARGDHVTVIDDLSTGSIKNIEHLKSHARFTYVIDTMENKPLLGELVDSVDRIYHLAAAVGVRLIVESPVRTIETNVHCTELLLAAAMKKKRRVFIASTSEVYGKSKDKMVSSLWSWNLSVSSASKAKAQDSTSPEKRRNPKSTQQA